MPDHPATDQERAYRLPARILEASLRPRGLAAVASVAAAVVLWLVISPLATATNDTDSASTVLYYLRILDGTRLESFVPTTPKPFLTLVYGLLWTATHDWRSLTVATLLVAAVATGLAACLAARLGGRALGPAAGVVAAVSLLAWPDFRAQTAGANSLVWGVALWLLAGVLVTGERSRPWAAGVALLLAGLTRIETLWIVAAAAAIALWLAIRPPGDRGRLSTVLPLLLGAAAVPIACVHDWLLTGDPLYWLGVSAGYTATVFPGMAPGSVVTMLHLEAIHFLPGLGLVALAAVGVVWMVFAGRRATAFALLVLFGGVLATLLVLTWRVVYVSDRYYEEADAPLLLAAAIGAAALAYWLAASASARRPARLPGPDAVDARPPLAVRVATPLLAGVVAVALAVVAVPQGSGAAVAPGTETVGGAAALASVEPELVPALSAGSGATGATVVVPGVDYPVADPAAARLYVPRILLPRVAVDMNVPITALGDSYLAFRTAGYSSLRAGQWVLHIAAADPHAEAMAVFEISQPSTLTRSDGTGLRLVPVYVDAAAGVWLIRVDAAPS